MLSYREIAKDEDRPPQEIWLNDEALNEHFEAVHARYNDKSEATETVPMDQNELTSKYKKGSR